MAPLCAAVLATFESSGEHDADTRSGGLGAGPLQMVNGLIGAFEVRARIQQALGMIMAEEQTNVDFAYVILRSRAAAIALSLTAAAGSVLTRAGDDQWPA
jgi:hypothetical protein